MSNAFQKTICIVCQHDVSNLQCRDQRKYFELSRHTIGVVKLSIDRHTAKQTDKQTNTHTHVMLKIAQSPACR